MEVGSMKVGKVYFLVGGLMMRYQGLYANEKGVPTGPCLAFRDVRDGMIDPPVDYSATVSDVLREVTTNDRRALFQKLTDCKNRGLKEDVDQIDHVLTELRITK